MAKRNDKDKARETYLEKVRKDNDKLLANIEANKELATHGEAYWQQKEVLEREARRLEANKAKRQNQKANKNAKRAAAAILFQPEEAWQRFNRCPKNPEISIFACKKKPDICNCMAYKEEASIHPTHLDFNILEATAAKRAAIEEESKQAIMASNEAYRQDIREHDELNAQENADLKKAVEESRKEILSNRYALLGKDIDDDEDMSQKGPSEEDNEDGECNEGDKKHDEDDEKDDGDDNLNLNNYPKVSQQEDPPEPKEVDWTEPVYSPVKENVLSDSDDTKEKKAKKAPPSINAVTPPEVPNENEKEAEVLQQEGAPLTQAKSLTKKKTSKKEKAPEDTLTKLLSKMTPEAVQKILQEVQQRQENQLLEERKQKLQELKATTKANRKQIRDAIDSARIDHAALESYMETHKKHVDVLIRQKNNSHKTVQIKFDAMGFTIDSLSILHNKETDLDLKESIYEVMEQAVNTVKDLIEQGQMFLRQAQMEKTTQVITPRLEDTKSKSKEQASYKNAAEKGAKNSKEHTSAKRQIDDQDENSYKRHRPEDNRKWEKPRQRDEVQSTSRQIPPESDEDVENAIIWETPNRRCIHRYACTQGFNCAFAHNDKEEDWFYEPIYRDFVASKDKKISAEFLEQLATNRKQYAKRFNRQIHRYVSNNYHNEVRHSRGGGGTSRGGNNYRGGSGGGSNERSSSSHNRDH